MSGVASRLVAIHERIAQASRDPDEITIVAVTKGFGPEACREAVEAGLRVLGENRVQEALGKIAQVAGADWHLIGHLQTNKVKLAVGRFTLIQTVDSLHLAEAIASRDPRQAVLVEVNVARETQKSGVDPDKAVELIAAVSGLLEVRGLMAMGPTHADPASAFQELAALRALARERTGRPLPVLSMGMSADFEAALAAGSTMLRLGRALFGPRPT
ncbi:MAG: YggS family pyridoxal phosphate-dependent enzyme [Candidatus Dormibacteraceae bacterium]